MAALGLADAFWCEQLPVSARDAVALADAQIARCSTPPTVVGSSLGGYYATCLAEKHGLKAVLINPAVHRAAVAVGLHRHADPHVHGRGLRVHPDPHRRTACHRGSGHHPARALLADWLKPATRCSTTATQWHATPAARQTVLEGGDHSFTRWDDYLDPILHFAGLLKFRRADSNTQLPDR
jgi:predicted esterase YcpF (UPF0227 family)